MHNCMVESFFLQIEYKGIKRYKKDGNMEVVQSSAKTESVPGRQDSVTIDGLEPKMRYDITIMPQFQDGAKGYKQPLAVQTKIEGAAKILSSAIRSETNIISH